jgi:hypothetical protein
MKSQGNKGNGRTISPDYWTDVYPAGTREGDEESDFFIALSRDTLVWRTTYQIAKATGLTEKRVEEIINKYLDLGLVFPHDRDDNKWAYWERVPELLPQETPSLGQKDQDDRIGKHMKKEGLMDVMYTYKTRADVAPNFGKTINGVFLMSV